MFLLIKKKLNAQKVLFAENRPISERFLNIRLFIYVYICIIRKNFKVLNLFLLTC